MVVSENSTKPVVSVIVATYNGARFLRDLLESICSQTYRAFEVIASDDASLDETVRILESYRRRGVSKILAHGQNVGSTLNFERAIAHASGDFIAFADQDDVWLPHKLELSAAKIMDQKADLVFSDARIVDEQLRPLGNTIWQRVGFSHKRQVRFSAGDAFGMLLRQNVVTGATVIARADLVRRFLPISTRWVHDAWMAILAAFFDARIELIDAPLLLYREHAGQQIGFGRQRRPPGLSRDWFRRETEVWQDLSGFIRDLDGYQVTARSRERLKEIDSKTFHLTARGSYPDARQRRIGPILREVGARRYARYSRGLPSAITDLLVRHSAAEASVRVHER